MTDNGLITTESAFSVSETVDRLVKGIAPLGLTVFAHIDHAAGAASVGMLLPPTQLVIFGSPKGGTPLMQDRQTAGIDLPLKALVWQDADGKVWLTYNDPAWIAKRHGLGDESAQAVNAMGNALAAITKAATRR